MPAQMSRISVEHQQRITLAFTGNSTLPRISVKRKVGRPSLRGSACTVAVCRSSPFQKRCSTVEVDDLEPLALAFSRKWDEETWCLFEGGCSSSSSESLNISSTTVSGLNLFWRSRRSLSSLALSVKKFDAPDPELDGVLALLDSTCIEVFCVPYDASEASNASLSSFWKRGSSISSSLSRLITSGLLVSWRLNAIALS